jgi:hypothetical protein
LVNNSAHGYEKVKVRRSPPMNHERKVALSQKRSRKKKMNIYFNLTLIQVQQWPVIVEFVVICFPADFPILKNLRF